MRKLLLLAAFAIAFASCKKDGETPVSNSCQLSVIYSDSARTDTFAWYNYQNGKIDRIYVKYFDFGELSSKYIYGPGVITIQNFLNENMTGTDTYVLNAQGYAAMQISGSDTTLYTYNSAGQMETWSRKSNGDTVLIAKYVFEGGNLVEQMDDLSPGSTTFEYDTSSPIIKWNPYFPNGSPGLEFLGKPLANKIPAKINGIPTDLLFKANSAGYPLVFFTDSSKLYYKYSNCQ